MFKKNITLVEYSDSINDLSRFDTLNKLIKQAELTYGQKEKICSFYKTPNRLNEIIRKLHICIDFMISSRFSDQDMRIMDYATHVLKMSSSGDEVDSNKQVFKH